MKNLKLAYQKLSENDSNVSAHYLVSRNGMVFNLLCPRYKAWHAGKSKWKKRENINDYSIGIELENKGHDYGYSNYTNKQYIALRELILFLKRNFYILNKNIIFHSDIAPNRKKDPGEKFLIAKINIDRFKYKGKIKHYYNIDKMLELYGFHISYIKNYKEFCIKAVKRSLNYKVITSYPSKKFLIDFYNLLFR